MINKSKEELIDEINDYKTKLATASDNIIMLLNNQSAQQEQYQELLNENMELVKENEILAKENEELKHYKGIAEHLMALRNN